MTEMRSLIPGFYAIETISSKLDLTEDLKISAKNIYEKLSDEGLIHGRHVKEMAIVSVKIALKKGGYSVIFNDFLPFISKDKKCRVSRYYHIAIQRLGLKINSLFPIDLVDKFCEELHLSERVRIKSRSILKSMTKKIRFQGKDPVGIIAGVMYFTALRLGERRTQEEIAMITGTTAVTIRKRNKDLEGLI